jgi:monoterpene epsilon-lactone hydrolase
MPSKQSQANKKHYEALAAISASGNLTPEEVIEWNDVHWTGLTAEPGGVDYIEDSADGVQVMWAIPKGAQKDRVIFYAHGGGFVSGSIYTHRKLAGHLAKATGCRVLLFEYAYGHEHKYPHQLDSAFTAYQWLLSQNIKPEHIALAGDSSGAILTVGVLQRARSAGLAMPAAVMLLSGWLDITLTGKTYETNRDKDVFFNKAGGEWLVSNFLGNNDRHNPLANPLDADLRGMPPIYLQAGTDETLLDDSQMFAKRASEAGVTTKLDLFPGMLHTHQMMAGRAPEADDAIARLAEWVRPKLGLVEHE